MVIFFNKFSDINLEVLMLVGEYKSPAGLIRAELRINNNEIEEVTFTGDFFVYPENMLKELEESLIGTDLKKDGLLRNIKDFYRAYDIKTPSLRPEHWKNAIERAIGDNKR